MRRLCSLDGRARWRSPGARCVAQARRRTDANVAGGSTARHRRGVKHVDVHDLETEHLDAGVARARSLMLEVFCLFSHSPDVRGQALPRRGRAARDIVAHPAVLLEARLPRRPRSTPLVKRPATRQVNVTFKVTEGRADDRPQRSSIAYDSTLISDKARKPAHAAARERPARPDPRSTRCA